MSAVNVLTTAVSGNYLWINIGSGDVQRDVESRLLADTEMHLGAKGLEARISHSDFVWPLASDNTM